SFPDAHHFAAHRRQVTRASARTLRRSQPNLDGADLQLGGPLRLTRTRSQLQLVVAQRRLRPGRRKEFARHRAPFFIGQTTILGRTDGEAMIEFGATDQLFIDVRAAITGARPFDRFVFGRGADRFSGLLPPLRFAGARLDDFRVIGRLAFRTGLPDLVVLHRQAQDFDARTTRPTLGLLYFPPPTHGQHRMQMEALQTGGAGANWPQPRDRLIAGPTHFAGIFQQQRAPWLVQLLDHQFTMSLLQILWRRFWV